MVSRQERNSIPTGDPAAKRAREGRRIERIGFRLAGIGGEFTSHVLAGLALGWGADWYFTIQPWGIITGLGAGLAVGTLQFVRHAAALNREMGPVEPPPGGFKTLEPDEPDQDAEKRKGGEP